MMLALTMLFLAKTAQTPPVSDDASAELLRLVKEDQADRSFFLDTTKKPTPQQMKSMDNGDRVRFKRTNEILDSAPKLTAEGFDAAALLMQHGSNLESFVRAHELSACASFLGKQGNLIAASEDRYLMNLKRKQRFGAQFVGFGKEMKLYDIDEQSPTSVTDSLRKVYFEPHLALAKTGSLAAAFKSAQSEIVDTMRHRMDPAWIKANSNPAVSRELAELPASPVGIKKVLDLYNADKLVSDEDFYQAGRVLGSSTNSEELLLAHELATVALKEGYKPARALFESTWDGFEMSIGHAARYANHKEPKSVQAVLEGG